jgi:hypothetical protein
MFGFFKKKVKKSEPPKRYISPSRPLTNEEITWILVNFHIGGMNPFYAPVSDSAFSRMPESLKELVTTKENNENH